MSTEQSTAVQPDPVGPALVPLGRLHTRRLREIYRSAGWPCQDVIEIDLLAAGMLVRVMAGGGHETLRVTDEGIALLARTLQRNRSSLSAHEALVEQVAREMVRNGRIAWRNLSLRAKLPACDEMQPARWCMARPDVFSIRNTSVATYVDPVVHEIKVRRSDLQSDLRKPDKRAAYLDIGGECWYVLGNDAKGKPVAGVHEVPAECGVMLLEASRLVVARPAPLKPRRELPFHVWMALARTTPLHGLDDDAQQSLADTACD
ncbi:MAG: hypothetical protein EOO28_00885 [Comamonadaceae bacterium]|nr:MAG: hypothetical protein EOO28_00885 [Comamonadaceae bacterium]